MFRPSFAKPAAVLRLAPLAACAALLGLALSARPGDARVRIDPLQRDSGTYRAWFRDQLLGEEKFTLRISGDTLVVESDVDQRLPGPSGDETLSKASTMTLKLIDYGLLGYVSNQKFLGTDLTRAINVADTTFTSYREVFPSGSAETFMRPPGRLFVIDSQVFVLFDVMLRSLHGRLEGRRTMPMIVLSEPRDTVIDITIRAGASESITLGGVAHTARRVDLTDGSADFVVWLSPEGRMLRLTQPATGLRVERVTPAPKRKPAPATARPPATPPKPSAPSGR